MTRKIVQRSPNVGIGIKLQPLTPVAAVVVVPTPEPEHFCISVSDAEEAASIDPVVILVHYVTFTVPLTVDATWDIAVVNVVVNGELTDGVDVGEITSADLSNGVVKDSGSTIVVPAGVSAFTVTLTVNAAYRNVTYQLNVRREFGLGHAAFF